MQKLLLQNANSCKIKRHLTSRLLVFVKKYYNPIYMYTRYHIHERSVPSPNSAAECFKSNWWSGEASIHNENNSAMMNLYYDDACTLQISHSSLATISKSACDVRSFFFFFLQIVMNLINPCLCWVYMRIVWDKKAEMWCACIPPPPSMCLLCWNLWCNFTVLQKK